MKLKWILGLWLAAGLGSFARAGEKNYDHFVPEGGVGGSAKRLRCSAILDYFAANGNKIPTSIDGWRRMMEGNGGATRTVFPVSRAPSNVDFDFPRFLLGAAPPISEKTEPWKRPANFGKLFVGLVPDDEDRSRQHAEVISYNDETGKYDFVLVKDFNNPSKREILTEGPEIDRCFSCHINQGPIFLPREWLGSIGNSASPTVGRIFFEHQLKKFPDAFREAAAKWDELKKKGENPERPPITMLMDYTVRTPDGSDTGFNFADSAGGMDTTVHHSALRRKLLHIIKGKKPEEREAFFRAAVRFSVFGKPSDDYYNPAWEAEKREKKPDDPVMFGDTIGARTPDLMRENPVEFLKRKKSGKLKLDKEFSMVSPGAVYSGNGRDRGMKFLRNRSGATEVLQFSDSDSVVFDALKTDLKAAGIEGSAGAVIDTALKRPAVSAILRDGIPQREKLLAALVSALKAEAKSSGAKQTPELDKIEYKVRECEHRWDGKRAEPADSAKERPQYGNCAWCHNKESGRKSRLFFGFDPGDPGAWKAALAQGDDKRRAKVRGWLEDAIEMLGETGMPPPNSPEATRFTSEERAKLKKALEALKR